MEFVEKYSSFFKLFPLISERLSRATHIQDLIYSGEKFVGKFLLPEQKIVICESVEKSMTRVFVQSYLGISKSRVAKMMVAYHEGRTFHDDN
eukprot:gene5577-7702_t